MVECLHESLKMTYEEFEWHILRMVYEEGVTTLQPSYLAYTFELPHETVSRYLEQAVDAGLLELNVVGSGRLEYFVPGADKNTKLPTPVWKKQDEFEALEDTSKQPPVDSDVEHLRALVVRKSDTPARADGSDGGVSRVEDGADGSVTGGEQGKRRPFAHGKTPELPPNLQAYIKERYGDTDGSLHRVVAQRGAVIERRAVVEHGASILDDEPTPALAGAGAGASTALVPYNNGGQLLRVETSEDAFCDPSQTIFMRQIRVHGVQSETALREHIRRLFEGFGYKTLNTSAERLRFERGSVTFILALVPLFVLILPLFVYLFLYCIGRSTIHQEPLELDVQIRKNGADTSSYDIDLTFIGLHGVVLGAADQRVLNQEIDTLRDELRWALTGS
jgi:hypothetical protein